MTCVSLALLGSKGGWRKPETANIKSTSTGPKNGERLPKTTPKRLAQSAGLSAESSKRLKLVGKMKESADIELLRSGGRIL